MRGRASLYETITNDLIIEFERGVVPWVTPCKNGAGALPLPPWNAASGHRYRGVNVLLLSRTSRLNGYRHPAWIGYHQAHERDGYVKRGEKATLIVYSQDLHPEDDHWSGHPSRLNCDLTGRFGDESYAGEKLIAELAVAYLCALLAIPGKLQHAESIGHWIHLLSHDSRAIFIAAGKATEAARYLEAKGGLISERAKTDDSGDGG